MEESFLCVNKGGLRGPGFRELVKGSQKNTWCKPLKYIPKDSNADENKDSTIKPVFPPL